MHQASVYNPITSQCVQHDHTLTTNGKRAETATSWPPNYSDCPKNSQQQQQQQKQSSLSSKFLGSAIDP